jgi:flagellar capping protein FliD
MFSLLNPWVIIGAICAVLGVYFYGHHTGYQERVAEDQAEIIRLNDEARAKESELNKKLANVNSALRKAKDDVKAKQVSINSRIDSGELRLPSSCPVQADSNPGATGGNTTNAGQSDRQAIKDIVAIVADGDAAITQLNTCINTYNQVRQTVNEGVK